MLQLLRQQRWESAPYGSLGDGGWQARLFLLNNPACQTPPLDDFLAALTLFEKVPGTKSGCSFPLALSGGGRASAPREDPGETGVARGEGFVRPVPLRSAGW